MDGGESCIQIWTILNTTELLHLRVVKCMVCDALEKTDAGKDSGHEKKGNRG